jgi:hypothetical protein
MGGLTVAEKIRVELNEKGVAELLNSAAVRDDLVRRGEAMAGAAGDGFEVSTSHTDRVRVTVRAETIDAKRAEAEDRALTRAIDAGRL